MNFYLSTPTRFLAVLLAVPCGLANAKCPAPPRNLGSACAGGHDSAQGRCPAREEAGFRGKRLVTPEDILKDGEQTFVSRGVTIRKGTIGSFMQNAQIFASPDRPAGERAAASKLLKEYALAIIAMDIDRQVTWMNPELEKIMAAARTSAPRPGTAPDAPEASRKAQPPTQDGPERPGLGVVKPQDLLSDQVDHFFRNGVKIRKGILLSTFINAATFSAPLDPQEKAAARNLLVQSAPAFVALGMHQVMQWNDPEIQRILDQAREAQARQAPGKA